MTQDNSESFVIGAGGHAKVVIDTFINIGLPMPMLFDDEAHKDAATVLGLRINAPLPDLSELPLKGHVAIGDNSARKKIGKMLVDSGKELLTLVNTKAYVSSLAELGAGSLVAAGAIIGPGARIGDGVIVNHAAIIDHDCTVGDYSHIAPNVTLGGNVSVGAGVLVGSGAVVLKGINIGDNAVVGAGAVVTKNIPANVTVTGIPAKKIS